MRKKNILYYDISQIDVKQLISLNTFLTKAYPDEDWIFLPKSLDVFLDASVEDLIKFQKSLDNWIEEKSKS